VATNVHISLTPALLSVAKFQNGRVSARQEFELVPGEWNDAMAKDLRPFDSVLAQAMRVLDVRRGTSVDVDYAGRDAVVDVLSYPSTGTAARDAALLALTDRIPGGSAGQPTSAMIIGRDRNERGRTHVLACVDKDQNAAALASWIARAGLRLGRLTPSAALPLTLCTQRVLECEDAGPVAAIYFGGAFTCIAAGTGGSVQLVRVMNFGVDLLTEAYLRDQGGRDVAPDTEARRNAQEQVWRSGIPSREEGRGGQVSILPLIVPIAQKFMVEIKQTLRFGLGETRLEQVKVIATGPGATIPNFTRTLSEGLEIPVDADRAISGAGRTVFDQAELAGMFSDHPLDLAPAVEAQARTSRKLSRLVATGMLLGVIAVAGDTAWTYARLEKQRELLTASAGKVAEGQRHFQNREQAAALSAAFGEQYKAITDAMAASPDWSAALLELGTLADQDVRLTQVDAQNNNGRPEIEITGLAFANAGADPLRAFMNKLMKSPMAQSVELGPTRAAEVEGRGATHFTLRATLRAMPADPGGSTTVAVQNGEGDR